MIGRRTNGEEEEKEGGWIWNVQSVIGCPLPGPHWPPKGGLRLPLACGMRPAGGGGVRWGREEEKKGCGRDEEWQGAQQLIAALQLLARPPRNREPALSKLPAGRRVIHDLTLGLD